jgi:hypothetical protein
MQTLNSNPVVLKVNQIYFNIFHYLYLSDKQNLKLKKNKPLSFKIPDTVLFIDDVPKLWVFTSKNGYIKRKYESKLNNNKILQHFEKQKINYGKDEILASYFYCSDDNMKIGFENPKENEDFLNEKKLIEYMKKKCLGIEFTNDLEDNFTLIHEFLDYNSLKDLLFNKNKRQGILQLFVESQQDPNSTYKLTWSPNYLTAQIKHSRQTKCKQNVHFYEKIVSFENDEYCINMEEVKSQIAINKLNNMCLETIDSIESLFNYSVKIKNIVLHMKQDLNFNVNLLYCSSIGFIEYEDKDHTVFVYKGRIFNNRLSDKFRFNPHKVIYFKNQEENYVKQVCISCEKESFKENFHEIDFHSIIKYHQYNRSKPALKSFKNKISEIFKRLSILTIMTPKQNDFDTNQQVVENELMRVENSDIPDPMRVINPDLNLKEYKMLMRNEIFLKKKVEVCESCFFEFIDIKHLTQNDFQAKIFQGNIKKNIVSELILKK